MELCSINITAREELIMTSKKKITVNVNGKYSGYVNSLGFKYSGFHGLDANKLARIIGNTVYVSKKADVNKAVLDHVIKHEIAHKIHEDTYGIQSDVHDERFFDILSDLCEENIREYYTLDGKLMRKTFDKKHEV